MSAAASVKVGKAKKAPPAVVDVKPTTEARTARKAQPKKQERPAWMRPDDREIPALNTGDSPPFLFVSAVEIMERLMARMARVTAFDEAEYSYDEKKEHEAITKDLRELWCALDNIGDTDQAFDFIARTRLAGECAMNEFEAREREARVEARAKGEA